MAFTYFFRDTQTLEEATNILLPVISGRSRIRIWDAGCAMGPEPYSLAILFSEKMGHFGFKNLKIQCSDIDNSNLFSKIIQEGIYSYQELSRMPKDLFLKYFKKLEEETQKNRTNEDRINNPQYQLDQKIRKSVEYQRHDLLSLNPIGSDFSLVVCKNVLLHFQYKQRIDVLKMFHRSLSSDGLLILEQTQKLPEEISDLFEKITSQNQIFKKVPRK